MKFGIVDQVFYDDFLSNQTCPVCHKEHDSKLIVYSKAFKTGPIVWWAWHKQGTIECKNCGAFSAIHPAAKEFKETRTIYANKAIPVRYFLTSIITGSVVGLLLLSLIISTIYNLANTTQEKLEGVWLSEDEVYTLFVFPDHKYTLIDGNDVVFGTYDVDKTSHDVAITIEDQENKLHEIDQDHVSLKISPNRDPVFKKLISHDKGEDPYRVKYNAWRIKPSHSESKFEIKQRVISYLEFLRLRNTWAVANHLTSDIITLLNDPNSPVMQANNGIAVYESTLDRWQNAFFNMENCAVANRFLYKSFPKDMSLNERERNMFKRNLKGFNEYLEKAKETEID